MPTTGVPARRPAAASAGSGIDAVPGKAVHDIFRQWLATRTEETELQERLTDQMLALLTPENTAASIRFLSPEELNTPLGARMLERWLALDAAEAARWLANLTNPTEQQAWLVAHASWRNAPELVSFCGELAEGAWKQSVLSSASLEMAEENPPAAIGLARQISSAEVRASVLETVAYAWFGRDFDAAASWTRATDDPQLREKLWTIGAKAVAVTDPDLAAGWLVDREKGDVGLADAARSVVETWADQKPREAADWLARIAAPEPRRTSISLVLTHWLRSDPAAARTWLETLPERDAIVAAMQANAADRGQDSELN